MNLALADRVLTARLEVKKPTQLDYKNERAEFLACQTVFQYLVGCWQRVRTAKADLPNTHRVKYNVRGLFFVSRVPLVILVLSLHRPTF